MRAHCLLAVALAFCLPALGRAQDVAAPFAEGAPARTDAPRSPEEEARRSRVFASIGDQRLTVGDVEDAIAAQPPFMRARYANRAQVREFADQMVRFRLTARDAEKRGFGERRAVRNAVDQYAVQVLVRREFDEKITAETVAAADVQAYYDAHPDEFHAPELRRASHIVVATEAEAREVVRLARDGDARTFRELARDRSLDEETKMRGGDLRFFPKEPRENPDDPAVDATLVAEAFSLREVGDVGDPIALGPRFSVVKLMGIRAAEARALAEAEPAIRMKLWREQRERAIEAFVAQLRARYRPEIHDDRVQAIRLDPPPEPT